MQKKLKTEMDPKADVDILSILYPSGKCRDVSNLLFNLLTPVDLGFMRLVCKEWKEKIPPQLFFHRFIDHTLGVESTMDKRNIMRMSWAVRHGSILLIKYLLEKGIKTKTAYFGNDINACVESGYFECVRFAYEHDVVDKASGKDVLISAARSGHTQMFLWFHRNAEQLGIRTIQRRIGHPFENQVCEGACAFGNLGILQFCLDVGAIPTESCMNVAALNANMRVLKFGIEKKFSTSSCTCAHAASSGSIECLQLLLDNGVPCTESATLFAYNARKYEMMEFLLSKGYPFSKRLCGEALYDSEFRFVDLFNRYNVGEHEVITSNGITWVSKIN